MSTSAENKIVANWFENGSSKSNEVDVVVEGEDIVISSNDQQIARYSLANSKISEKFARLPRTITFPDGNILSIENNDQTDLVFKNIKTSAGLNLVDKLERNLKFALLSIVLLIGFCYFSIQFLIPAAANPLSKLVPSQMTMYLDAKLIELFKNHHYLIELSHNKYQARLERAFVQMDLDVDVNLYAYEVSDRLGANAFALPGGTIVFTEALMDLDLNDNEIKAILAHEIGHVVNRHGLRGIIQNTSLAILAATLIGDVSWVAEVILVSTPVLLKSLSYGREFEREADQYSINILEDLQIPTSCLGTGLEKLVNSHYKSIKLDKQKNPDEKDADLQWLVETLSTHPKTSDRIRHSGGQECL